MHDAPFQDYDDRLPSAACSELNACLMYDSFYRARACTQAFSDVLIGHTSSGENKCFSLPLGQRIIVSFFHESTASTHPILLHAHQVGNFGISVLIRRHCEGIRRMYSDKPDGAELGDTYQPWKSACLPGLQNRPLFKRKSPGVFGYVP